MVLTVDPETELTVTRYEGYSDIRNKGFVKKRRFLKLSKIFMK